MPPKRSAAATGRKRVAKDYEDDGFVVADEGATPKKAKVSGEPVKAKLEDHDNNDFWELSDRRRVTVSEFKGKPMVDIREYYEKDGLHLPGRKGIALNIEQYNALMELLPQIEASMVNKGETVLRPQFDGAAAGAPAKGDGNAAAGDASKKNFEATSDEDDG